jgi:hypothetical protein
MMSALATLKASSVFLSEKQSIYARNYLVYAVVFLLFVFFPKRAFNLPDKLSSLFFFFMANQQSDDDNQIENGPPHIASHLPRLVSVGGVFLISEKKGNSYIYK